jgi:(+)-trans-carveol dehydrogenase/(-)-trans-carveol dehydrogenase
MGRVDGKVAFITGAARGQGRSHALRLAQEGADIIAVDLLEGVESVPYPLSTKADLDETARLVESLGRKVLTRRVDVRELDSVEAAVRDGLDEFAFINVVSANAGVVSYAPGHELTEQAWRDVLDINLTGVWHTVRSVVPSMIAAGRGGSIILTSSMAGLRGIANAAHYAAAKHGVVGLMRTFAKELAHHSIRVNSVHPSSVDTDMIHNEATYALFRPGKDNPTLEDAMSGLRYVHALPVPWVAPEDISNAVLWLASDEARYVTGIALPIDAGYLL